MTEANKMRWTCRKKAELLSDLRSGKVSLEDVTKKYDMSIEEIELMADNVIKHGISGLKSTRLSIMRREDHVKKSIE